MKTLLEYILESIGSAELSKDLSFDQIDQKTVEKLIVAYGIEKLGEGLEDVNDIFGFGASLHYKIMYKNICLGVIGYNKLSEIFDMADSLEDKTTQEFYRAVIKYISYKAINVPETKYFLYVTYILLFDEGKKEADINPIATIKTVFDKIKTIAKKDSVIEYIVANGKDEHITKLYCKCGGFKLMPSKETSGITKHTHKILDETTIYYKL